MGLMAGWGASAQLPDAPRGSPSSRSPLPDAAGHSGSPGRSGGQEHDEPGAAPANPASRFSAFPDAAFGQAPPGSAPTRPAPGAARPPAGGGSGGAGGPMTGGGGGRAVPLIGAGNFCMQPAGLCGPACSVSCQEGRMAYCTGGQGGPTSPTGAGACATPPSCSCR